MIDQTSHAVRYTKEIPLIDPATFALEEYKAIQTKINQHRDMVSRLETFTIGGTVAGAAFLLGIGRTRCEDLPFTRIAWWGLIALVVAAAVRCGAYYFYIFHLRKYVMDIEQRMKSANYQLVGIETHTKGKWLRRLVTCLCGWL